jgi:hypothetical protein
MDPRKKDVKGKADRQHDFLLLIPSYLAAECYFLLKG